MSLFYGNHMIMSLCSGTCGLTLVLTRCIVRTRKIPLIIMIRVKILSAENSYFTCAFSRGCGRSVRFMEREISRCVLLPPVSNLFRSQSRFTITTRRIAYFLNPRFYFRIGDRCEIGTRELYGPINYIDLRNFPRFQYNQFHVYSLHVYCHGLNIFFLNVIAIY